MIPTVTLPVRPESVQRVEVDDKPYLFPIDYPGATVYIVQRDTDGEGSVRTLVFDEAVDLEITVKEAVYGAWGRRETA